MHGQEPPTLHAAMDIRLTLPFPRSVVSRLQYTPATHKIVSVVALMRRQDEAAPLIQVTMAILFRGAIRCRRNGFT